MGLATAYWLSKTKSRILLLDQYTIGNDYCSSQDANRVFRYSYGRDLLYTRMAHETLAHWKNLERESGETLLIPCGLLLLQTNDEESNRFNQDTYKALTDLDLGIEELDQSELARKYPQFHTSHAYLDTHGGVLLASKTLTTLASIARRQGVTILENHKATKIIHDSQLQIETSHETVKCRKAIVTTGPWSNNFRAPLLPPITPTRQQILYFQPQANLHDYRPGRFPVFFAGQYYGLPTAGIEGVKVSHKGLDEPVNPDTANRTVDSDLEAKCRRVCREFIPSLASAPVHQSKVCLYDMSRNSDFIIARDPEHSSLVYGYGFSGHGFKFAPLVGRLLSELAIGQPPSLDLARFTPKT